MTTLSYEIFPPKSQVGKDNLIRTIAELKKLDPKFISVTCSNKETNFVQKTIGVTDYVQNQCDISAMVHLPAWYLNKKDVDQILYDLCKRHINQVLVLRGDTRKNLKKKGDFEHASDLISYIRQNYPDFHITGACYPEKHPESLNMVEEIQHLKFKVNSGCDQIITQFFLDNHYYYHFRELCAIAKINIPIIAGIMPVTNTRQITRILKTSTVKIPEKFKKIWTKYHDNPSVLNEIGITYAIDQIVDLVTNDVDKIHLYTMNRFKTAHKIKSNIGSLLK